MISTTNTNLFASLLISIAIIIFTIFLFLAILSGQTLVFPDNAVFGSCKPYSYEIVSNYCDKNVVYVGSTDNKILLLNSCYFVKFANTYNATYRKFVNNTVIDIHNGECNVRDGNTYNTLDNENLTQIIEKYQLNHSYQCYVYTNKDSECIFYNKSELEELVQNTINIFLIVFTIEGILLIVIVLLCV